jgi:glycosyltransferase involved in cell wall biosynthesis
VVEGAGGENMLRIGYLMQNGAVDLSQLSGPQLHIKAVIHGLQKRGHMVRTIAFQDRRLVWSDDLEHWWTASHGFSQSTWFRLIERPLRRFQYQFNLPYLGWFDSLRYADSCRQCLAGFDLLYERHGYMGYGGVIASRWMGIPLVIELNGNIIKEIDEIGVQMSDLQRSLGKWITHRTWRAASHLVLVSKALKESLVNNLGFQEESVSVVLNGVDIQIFTLEYDQQETRNRYCLGNGPLAVFVGSFQPWHGVNLLVESFSQVRAKVPNARLVLVGDGSGRDEVLEQISQMGIEGAVILTGQLPQKQVAAVLSAANILVAPYPLTHGEIVGTPLKLLEYMAAGKAIVASTAPIHEVIESGVTGLRVEASNSEALAEGMLRLINNEELCKKLGENARRKAVQCYSWDHTVDQLETIFQNLGKAGT